MLKFDLGIYLGVSFVEHITYISNWQFVINGLKRVKENIFAFKLS